MSGINQRLQNSEEALLVLRAQEGEGAAFRSLVERYDRRLLYFVGRIIDDAEESYDVVQAVWLHVHRKLNRLRAPQAFRVWLYRIAHDQAIAVLRKRMRQPAIAEPDVEKYAEEDEPDSAFESAELVHAGLAGLSIDHRRVLTLRFLEDMSVEDIADVVSCSAGTVKSRLHYAKAALRRRIEELTHG